MPYKPVLTSILLCFFLSHASGQEIGRSTLAADGGTARTSAIQIDWTLGEATTETVYASSLLLTQGYQQPLLQVSKDQTSREASAIQFRIYPNPTAAAIHVEPLTREDLHYELTLTDASGKRIQNIHGNCADGLRVLQMQQCPSGLYFATIRTREDNAQSTYRITKI